MQHPTESAEKKVRYEKAKGEAIALVPKDDENNVLKAAVLIMDP